MDITLQTLTEMIPDGVRIAIPATRSGPSLAITKALIARGTKDLHLVAVPTSGLQADMLIGAGCVSVMESAGVTLDEFGQAPRFVAAVRAGQIKLMDSTCPAIISAIQAGEKGIPFIPMRGLIGSDLLKFRPDYKVIDNPLAEDDHILILPSIRPDVTIFHAPLADRFGNVWIGKSRELMTMAHASVATLATFETWYDGNLMDDPLRGPATIPSYYISGYSHVENGTWPIGLAGHSSTDADALRRYAAMAKSAEGFDAYLDEALPQQPAE